MFPFQQILLKWIEHNERSFPWRKAIHAKEEMIEFGLPQKINRYYAIFIAEFLLMRTNAAQVAQIYLNFLSLFPDFKSLASLSEEDVVPIFSSKYEFDDESTKSLFSVKLGFDKRANWLIQISQVLHQSNEIPNSEQKLLDLPGIGQYTARAYLAFAHNQDIMPVDTNFVRLFVRLFALPGWKEIRRVKWFDCVAQYFVPVGHARSFVIAVLDFMSQICLPAKPKCDECPLLSMCCFGQVRTSLEQQGPIFHPNVIIIPEFEPQGLKLLLKLVNPDKHIKIIFKSVFKPASHKITLLTQKLHDKVTFKIDNSYYVVSKKVNHFSGLTPIVQPEFDCKILLFSPAM